MAVTGGPSLGSARFALVAIAVASALSATGVAAMWAYTSRAGHVMLGDAALTIKVGLGEARASLLIHRSPLLTAEDWVEGLPPPAAAVPVAAAGDWSELFGFRFRTEFDRLLDPGQRHPYVAEFWTIGVPLWFVLGVAAVPAAWSGKRLAAMRRASRFRREGRCTACGADLTVTPARCPACGLRAR